MSRPIPQTIIVNNSTEQSTLGLVGLIFSIIGWFTCGLLCIPGALLSFAGLFSSKAKSFAIAGLVIGFPGVVFFAVFGVGFVLTMLGLGSAATIAASEAAAKVRSQQQLHVDDALPALDDAISVPETQETYADEAISPITAPPPIDSPPLEPLPELETPVTSEPEPEPAVAARPIRIFKDITGRFAVEAEFVGVAGDSVTIKRVDDGRELVLPLQKLSQADRDWIAQVGAE